MSRHFLDTVTARFAEVAEDVRRDAPALRAADRTPTWAGWADVEALSERYGIGDVTLVKPGVGETTRVLLRRVPWAVLVRPDAGRELDHVRLLAERRGVPVHEVPGLTYRSVGLIHPRYTRGATGADGRAAAMSVLIATDLDRTLIYSRGAVEAHDDTDLALVAVERHEDKDASWMTVGAAAAFARLPEHALVVPVTTRTPEQWHRIRLPGPRSPYVITANGGILLVDGHVDHSWDAAVAAELAQVAPLAEIWEHASRICRPEWTVKLRNARGLFCYAVLHRKRVPAGFPGRSGRVGRAARLAAVAAGPQALLGAAVADQECGGRRGGAADGHGDGARGRRLAARPRSARGGRPWDRRPARRTGRQRVALADGRRDRIQRGAGRSRDRRLVHHAGCRDDRLTAVHFP